MSWRGHDGADGEEGTIGASTERRRLDIEVELNLVWLTGRKEPRERAKDAGQAGPDG